MEPEDTRKGPPAPPSPSTQPQSSRAPTEPPDDDESAALRSRPDARPMMGAKGAKSALDDSSPDTQPVRSAVGAIGGKPGPFAGGEPSNLDVRKKLGIDKPQGSSSAESTERTDRSTSAPNLKQLKEEGPRAQGSGALGSKNPPGGRHINLNIHETLNVSDSVSATGGRESADTFAATGKVGGNPTKVFDSSASQDHVDGLFNDPKHAGAQSGSDLGAGSSKQSQYSVMQDAGRAETLASKDALSREALTAAVANFLTSRTDNHALAIALFGAWGSGKSSFIKFVREELDKRQPKVKFRYAEFNAWKNERVDNIGAAFAQSVVTELVSRLSPLQQLGLAIKIAIKRTQRFRKGLVEDAKRTGTRVHGAWFDWLTVFGPLVAWPLLTGIALYLLFARSIGPDTFSKLLAAAGAAGSVVYSASRVLSKQLLNWFQDLAKDKKFSFKLLPDYAEKLGSFHEMGETLSDLVHLSLVPHTETSREYLLLVVDDLDRCSPDTIKQVFDAVRLVAHIENVVVLVALDERIAYTAIAKHYADYGREPALVARDYLAKVFNVFIALPTASPSAISNYVRSELFTRVEPSEEPVTGTRQPEANDDEETTQPGQPVVDLGSSSELEVQTFTQLVEKWELSNPRELWRLRQTWALLKGVAFGKHVSDSDISTWMRHMFLREMFLQRTADQRAVVEEFVRSYPDNKSNYGPSDRPVAQLNEEVREIISGFKERDPKVLAVLLPAAPRDLRQSASK